MSDPSIPTCLNCGYALKGLVESRCPECGHAFDPGYVEQFKARQFLLPWERPEIGGVVKRTVKTVWVACIHPVRYFESAEKRQNQPIHGVGPLILAIIIGSILAHVGGVFLRSFSTVVQLAIRRGDLGQALDIALRSRSYTLRWDWFYPSVQIPSESLTILLSSTAIYLVGRQRVRSFHLANYFALFSPILFAAAIIHVFGMIMASIFFGALLPLAYLTAWIPIVLFVLMVWNCCRGLLRASRAMTLLLSLMCLGFNYFSSWPVNLVLIPILQKQLPPNQ